MKTSKRAKSQTICIIMLCVLMVAAMPALLFADTEPEPMQAATVVTTFAQLQTALNNASVTNITINANIRTTATLNVRRAVTFSGSGTLDADGGNFRVITIGSGGHLTLQGDVTITGSIVGGVNVQNGGSLTMGGGNISGNTSTGNGGGVIVSSGGEFAMSGGNISGNTSAGTGGGVSVSGEFIMAGGAISGNTSTGNGGGVSVSGSNSEFTMNGGTISGNTARDGGGVFVNSEFIMGGGNISGNTSTSSGGGVFISSSSEFTMSGGTISRNTANNNGGGVFVTSNINSEFTMTGGTISRNTANNNGGGVFVGANGSLTIYDGYIYLNTSPISMNISGNFTNPNNRLVGVRPRFAVTVQTLPELQTALQNTEITHIIINNPIVTSTTITIGRAVTFSGSGTLNAAGGNFRVITIESGGHLTLTGDARITGSNGGGVLVDNDGEFTMNGGTISGNAANSGGGVFVNSGGKFTMNGGIISGNTANSGGGVFTNGTFTICDGHIYNNTAPNGANVYGSFANPNNRQIGSPPIPGETRAVETFAELQDALDNPAITRVNVVCHVVALSTINVTRAVTFSGYGTLDIIAGGDFSVITIRIDGHLTLEDNVRITGGNGWNGGGVNVGRGKFTMNGGTISGNNVRDGGDGGGGVRVGGGEFIMNGGTISDNIASGMVSVWSGKFTMNDGTIDGNTATGVGGVLVSEFGEFIMNGGTISRITGNSSGVIVDRYGEFTMNGGTISDNTGSIRGGGVNVRLRGVFTMNGGIISGNITGNNRDGGGVFVDGEFTMNGGEISGNNARHGGGVFISSGFDNIQFAMRDGKFTMNGGEISGNNARHGGGVFIDSGFDNRQFTMNNGTIGSNIAFWSGGGVYVARDGGFIMDGGNISDNIAREWSGGGVFIDWSGEFTMSGGTITGNSADNWGGGGVYVRPTGTLIISGGDIYNNTAPFGENIYGIFSNPGQSLFTVTFDLNSGSFATAPLSAFSSPPALAFTTSSALSLMSLPTRSIQSGDPIGLLPQTPTLASPYGIEKDGYRFTGWFTDTTNETTRWRCNTPVTGDVTLYARWKPIPDPQNFQVGAVSGNRRITSAGATMIARALQSGNFDGICRLAADIDGDGEVTPADIVLLARWLVGHNVRDLIAM